jgi:ABC-type nitrate/sulfonate/bicarbonate transport system permease component
VRRVNLLGLGTLAGFLGLWEALVRSRLLNFQYLPAPSATAAAAWDLVLSGQLTAAAGHTLEVTLIGWVAASAAGVVLGLTLGLSRTAWRYSMASIEVMRAIPPVALVPIAFLVFGFSIRMELVIIMFVSSWPVLVNTIDGVRGVPAALRDVARVLRLSNGATIRKITVPAALPTIVVGLRLALSLSLVLAVVAEMIGNPAGLGNALVRAQQALQPAQMFAYVLSIGLLGVALNAAFQHAARWVVPGLGKGAS